MKVATTLQKVLLSIVICILPIVSVAWIVIALPRSPEGLVVSPGLRTLPKWSASWQIFPLDFYEGGQWCALPSGDTRYWVIGPGDGKKVVLIHGLSIPSIVFKDIAPVLAAQGFRVLLYDLYGRGYSDAPKTTYSPELYTTQLALLMQHVGWNEGADVVGLSMGGGIAAAFAMHFPRLVNNVGLIASAGLMESSDMSRTIRFMSSPLVQLLTSSSPFRAYLQHRVNSSVGPNPIQDIVRIQSAHLEGYNAALSSSLRSGPIRGLLPAFKNLAEPIVRNGTFVHRKVLVVHGTADTTVPYRHAPLIHSLLPLNSELITIAGAGHNLVISHSDEVSQALLRFLS